MGSRAVALVCRDARTARERFGVADEAVTDKTTESLRVLNRFLRDDDRVSMSLLAIGDGITLCTKR